MTEAVTVVVLADTHLRCESRAGRWLPEPVVGHLAGADVVLHAGDVIDPASLQRIESEAGGPVHAVLGNNDRALAGVLPIRLELELAGVRIGMVHDSGPRKGREGRLRRLFPACQVVIFGHSHEPVALSGVDGQLLFNPGSPTQRRRQPVPTFGVMRLAGGRVVDHCILPV